MIQKKYFEKAIIQFNAIDWQLLVFVILFLDVKLAFKVVAVVLIYALRFNMKFGLNLRHSRLPIFYLLIILIGLLNYFFSGGFHHLNYTLTVFAGISFWMLAFLAMHQVKLSIETQPAFVIENTIVAFFIINAICSLVVLLEIIFKTGALNPFLYQGNYQEYFMGTGDYIKGVSFDTSTTNAILNAFGVIFFLERKRPLMVLLCMSVLLLTGSNITNIFLSLVLLFVFIFQSNKVQKSLILICCFLFVVFVTKVSPQNNQYIIRSLNHFEFGASNNNQNDLAIASAFTRNKNKEIEEAKERIAYSYLDSLGKARAKHQRSFRTTPLGIYVIPKDDINGPTFQYRSIVSSVEKNMFFFINAHQNSLPLSTGRKEEKNVPGKIISWKQTFNFLSAHPREMLTGTGIGNFSSKIAFKASGIGMAGSWPSKYKYMGKSFLHNHLDLYLNFFSKPDGFHSVVNSPASVYDQLLSEYGIAGLAAYFLFYIGFFMKRINWRSFKLSLIFLLSAFFFFDYWFEQLSIVIIFELFQFLNDKETLSTT
ncbi:MAG TPA: hypothetical protein VFD44_07010 [Hanamia sp.]|nr:hypothetical protein [Hanamia sp.]